MHSYFINITSLYYLMGGGKQCRGDGRGEDYHHGQVNLGSQPHQKTIWVGAALENFETKIFH
jgi:hypothetical protein